MGPQLEVMAVDRTPQVLHTDAQPAACHVSCFTLSRSNFPSWDRAVVPLGDLCSVWTPDDLGLAPVFSITPSKASLYCCSAQRLFSWKIYHFIGEKKWWKKSSERLLEASNILSIYITNGSNDSVKC